MRLISLINLLRELSKNPCGTAVSWFKIAASGADASPPERPSGMKASACDATQADFSRKRLTLCCRALRYARGSHARPVRGRVKYGHAPRSHGGGPFRDYRRRDAL